MKRFSWLLALVIILLMAQVSFAYTPTDPFFDPEQWHLYNHGQTIGGSVGVFGDDISAREAWDIEKGNSNNVTVAVIDSGVDFDHPDLFGKTVAGYNFAGITQDSNDSAYILGRNATQVYAQSITGTGDNLTHAGLILAKVGSPTSNINIAVRSTLDSTDLATVTIQPSDVVNYEFAYKQLSTPVMLNSGDTYYIIISASGYDLANYYQLYYAENNKYAEGVAYTKPSDWEAQATQDFCFKTNPNNVAHDDYGTGTHSAGIIVANNNTIGGVGVAPGSKVKVMPLKVFTSTGTWQDSDIHTAIEYAVNRDVDLIVCNVIGEDTENLKQSVVNAYTKRIPVICALGDSNGMNSYPADYCLFAYENLFGVGATTNRDVIAGFSNRGNQYHQRTTVVAPGQDVFSTMPTYDCYQTTQNGLSKNYYYMSSTRASASIVAGSCALVLSKYPSYNSDMLNMLLRNSSKDLGDSGYDNTYGWGRVDAYSLLSPSFPPPHISSVDKTQVKTGETIEIRGTNFLDEVPGASGVKIGGTQARLWSWSDTVITASVPSLASGSYGVVVSTPYSSSNAVTIDVTREVEGTGSCNWYFAEGSTWPGFDEWVLLMNPNQQDARITVKFLTPNGCEKTHTDVVKKNSRYTLHVNEFLSNKDISTFVSSTVPLIGERAMYFDGTNGDKWGSHESIGARKPSKTWYLAEGATWPGYDEWVMVMNPNDSSVQAQVTFQTPTGQVQGPKLTMQPWQRQTVHVNDIVPNRDVSTTVTSLSSKGIVAERSMYVTAPGKSDCHNSVGVTSNNNSWYLAEGCTRPGFEEWVLVMNPNDVATTGKASLMTNNGVEKQVSFDVPPHCRYTMRVNDYLPNKDVSVYVSTEKSVIVERSIYMNTWDNKRGCTNSPGSTPKNKWYLAEGCSLPGFETWVLIMNVTYNTPVDATLTFLKPNGTTVPGPKITLQPNTRQSVRVNDYVQDSVSTIVSVAGTNPQVIVERAMYMSGSRGGATDSLGYR